MAQADVSTEHRPIQDSAKPPPWATALRWVLLVAVVVLAGVVVQRLVTQGLWLAVVGVAFVAMAVLAVYGTRRAVPLKYLMPGLLFLLALQVWPIVYTVGTAFTNFGDGHRVSKQESIDSIIANSVQEVPGSSRYKLTVAVKEGADIATAPPVFLLTDPQGKTFLGDASGLEDLHRRRRGEEPGRQGHRGPRLHDPQRPTGQRPQGPGHLRGAHAGRRRDQARRPQ